MSGNPTHEQLVHVYESSQTIAVVGASDDPAKHSHSIPEYLMTQGYTVIPVNGHGGEVLGEQAYASLRDIDSPVDIVDVFRPANEIPDIARDAVAIGARVLWLQQGIVSEEGRRIATDNGLVFVENICIGATHAILGLTR